MYCKLCAWICALIFYLNSFLSTMQRYTHTIAHACSGFAGSLLQFFGTSVICILDTQLQLNRFWFCGFWCLKGFRWLSCKPVSMIHSDLLQIWVIVCICWCPKGYCMGWHPHLDRLCYCFCSPSRFCSFSSLELCLWCVQWNESCIYNCTGDQYVSGSIRSWGEGGHFLNQIFVILWSPLYIWVGRWQKHSLVFVFVDDQVLSHRHLQTTPTIWTLLLLYFSL